MVGIQVPKGTEKEFGVFLGELKYPYVEESDNEIYKQFLK